VDQNLKVGLVLTATDQNASATVKTVAASVDGLSSSLDRNATIAQRNRAAQDAHGASMQSAMGILRELDALEQKETNTLSDLERMRGLYNKALQQGLISQSEAAKGLATLAQGENRLLSARNASAAATRSATTASEGLRVSMAGLQREAGVLVGELLRGNFSAFERSLVTLARQGGILEAAFTGTGAAIAGTLGIIAGGIATVAEFESRQNAFNRALILTDNAAGLTTDALEHQVSVIGEATGKYGNAREALTLLATSGKFAGAELENAAQGVVAGAELTGKSIKDVAAEYVALAKDPYNATVKLGESISGVVNPSLLEQIRLLELSGDKAAAGALAADAFTDAFISKEARYREGLTGIAAGYQSVKEWIDKAYNSTVNFVGATAQGVGGFLSHPIDALSNLLGDARQSAYGGRSTADQTALAAGQDAAAAAAKKQLADAANETKVALDAETAALEKQAEVAGKTKEQIVLNTAAKRLGKAASAEEADAILDALPKQLEYARALDAATAAKKHHTDASKIENQILSELNAEVARGQAIEAAYADNIGGPVVAATRKANTELDALRQTVAALGAQLALGKIKPEEFAKGIADAAEAANHVADGLALVKAKQAALTSVQEEGGNAIDRLNAKWASEIDALHEGADAYSYNTERIKDENAALAAYNKAISEAHSPEEVAKIKASRDAFMAHADSVAADTIAAKKNAAQYKEWQQIGLSAADTLANGIGDAASKAIFHFKSIGDFFHSLGDVLKQTAQQVVSQIIAQFARLAVINPILNAIFGGQAGWSALPQLASSGVGGSPLGMDFLGTAGNINTGATGTGLYGQFAGAISNNPALVGQIGGIGGAVGGAYYGYQHAGGGVGGVAAGAAYGTAGYIAGTTIAGGVIGASAAGVAGATAGASGAFMGTLALLGPIGWIALAAVFVDMVSGGKLFGTAGKLIGGASTLSVGPDGASVASHYTVKGQKPLFGGATYKEHSYDDPAADAAAQAFYDAMKSGADQFAKLFGVKAADVASGSFEQRFDKKGNVTGSTTTIAGHTYEGESQADFGSRVQAETEIGVLSQFDKELSTAIDKYRTNAADLLAIVNDLATAQLAMNAGEKFLALGSDQSISKLLDFAAANQRFGESIDQTLQRIMQAQAQYDQFVGQFKPTVKYADAFQEALANIGAEYKANVKQANDLAHAAGAAGASEEDLTNIHKHATDELATAIKQLQDASQQLAISLGYTTQGMTVDQIDQQIAAIRNGTGDASQNLHGFGNAITEVSHRASDALNLLLGDLSPLTDMEKIQKALQGLRQGLVTQDQVLTIGRRLYGSSQQYTDLFNEVQHFPGSAGANLGGNAGGSGGNGRHPLTAAEQKQISDLEQQRKDAENAQRHNEALQLARNIAELSTVTGESYADIAKSEGFDIHKLMKDLGVTSEDQLNKMLDGFKSQQDSSHQDSQDLLSAIMQLPLAIADALNGGPGLISIHHPNQTQGTEGAGGRSGNRASTPGGHSGHGGRTVGSDESGAEMGRGFLRIIDTRAAQSDRRNGRDPFRPTVR
jgi:hypothetical protein